MARTSTDELETARDRLAAKFAASGAASLTVAAAREGEVVFEQSYGLADRATGRAPTPDTPYSLASITKPITAAALGRLIERGDVDLDEPIERYLGGATIAEYGGSASTITVRQVANHTAGLPLHYQFFYEDEPYRPPGRPETMRRYAAAGWPAGERYAYSNLGYGVLDHLLSTVTGSSYADVVRSLVLEPLGMQRSSVHLDESTSSDAAVRYGADGVAYPFYDFDHPGGSAVFASARDLLTFASANLAAPSLLHEPTARSAGTTGYGVGWMTHDDEAGFLTRGHTGGMGGVSTVMAIVPEQQLAVVALSNSNGVLPQLARVELLSALLPSYAARRDEVEAQLLGAAAAGEGDPPSEDVLRRLAGVWEGEVSTYAGPLGLRLDVRTDGEVHARLGSQLRTLVNRLRWNGRLAGVMFGDLETEDARRRPHHVLVDLGLREEDAVLDGWLTALTVTPDGEGGAPGRRVGNALSHVVRLGRA